MDSSETQALSPWEAAPFVVEHLRLDPQPDGSFRPAACVLITPALRTSGLLASLPAAEMQSLLFLLSFVTPNGRCLPSVQELVAATGEPERSVRQRMERLAGAQWRGQPLAHEVERESGMDAFAPGRGVLADVLREPEPPSNSGQGLREEPQRSTRDAAIAHSRARYTRPRDEVERDIAEFYGWELPGGSGSNAGSTGGGAEDRERVELRRRLFSVGIGGDQAEAILDEFPAGRIRRQLDWLPYRKARERSRLLIAAIAEDYEEPPALRGNRAQSGGISRRG
ncbi:hypothetical protein CCAX7_61940 [Capsulimonas corticalis]|uniref:Uncharacterized protein n=1 Tax=Capsulimonas corticalis TaxID=2219043 RepID=A0A402CWF0_9BACT|nr:hypothetical protein [Capsulimonas corticalis]BDI34143.1 hypothetical protein CCAX7_61940 [Capsulimonas corticalis]